MVTDLLAVTFSTRSIRKRLGWWGISYEETGDKMQLARTLAENVPLTRFPHHDFKEMCTRMGLQYKHSKKAEFHVDQLNGLLQERQSQRQTEQQDVNVLVVHMDGDELQNPQGATTATCGVEAKHQPCTTTMDQVDNDEGKEDVPRVEEQDDDPELSIGPNSTALKKPHLLENVTRKCFEEDWDTTKNITQISKIKQSVLDIVKQYLEKVDTAFDSRTLPPYPKKFDPIPGAPLQVTESACSGTKYSSRIIITDMKKLLALANAEHQESFLQDVRLMLHGWENFFSSYFTEEIKQMVTKLNFLIKEIDDEPSQQLASTELSGRMKQVDEMLEEALLVRETITRSVVEIEQIWLDVSRSQECIKVHKAAHANNVQKLEKEIQELQRKLADEKESLRIVESLEVKNACFFTEEMAVSVSEAIAAASTSFENVTAKGMSLREELANRLKRAEECGGLPVPVHALRSLIARYPIKE